MNIKAMVRAQIGDGSQYRPNPNGQYPCCKPALGTNTCERCGDPIVDYSGPCPAVPVDQRWGDDWRGERRGEKQ